MLAICLERSGSSRNSSYVALANLATCSAVGPFATGFGAKPSLKDLTKSNVVPEKIFEAA